MAREVSACIDAMRALVPGFELGEADLDRLEAGLAWCAAADPLVGRRVGEAAGLVPHVHPVDLPEPDGTYAQFMREVGDVHRDLYAEQGELYGENISPKIERCLEVTEAEALAAASLRAEYERRARGLMDGLDILLTPTLGLVAPPADVDELAIRERLIRFTYPFNLLGWPALALPCGPAEDGLAASIQIVGRPGADGLVLAAGLALEARLRA